MNQLSKSPIDSRLAAIVLCGGQSQRMGTAKANLRFGDELLIERVVRLLSQLAEHVLVVAAPDQQLPELLEDVIVLRDRVPDQGPLEAIACGLRYLDELNRRSNRGDVKYAWVHSVDSPFVSRELVEWIWSHVDGETSNSSRPDAIVAKNADHSFPLTALYQVAVHQEVDRFMSAGNRRVLSLLDHLNTMWVDLESTQKCEQFERAVTNMNSPQQYEQALRDCQTAPNDFS